MVVQNVLYLLRQSLRNVLKIVLCRENYLFNCMCSKCIEGSVTEPDVTSEEEEEEEEDDSEDVNMA